MDLGLITPLYQFVGVICAVGAVMFIVLAAMLMFARWATRWVGGWIGDDE